MNDENVDASAERQRGHFDKFMKMDGAQEAIKVLRDVAEAADLKIEDLGVKWGVTACVDKDTFVRLNVADYALFDVRDPAKSPSQRECAIAFLPKGRLMNIKLKATGIRRTNGFRGLPQGEALAESTICWCTFGEVEQLLSMGFMADAIRAHVDARPRKTFPTRHNPFLGVAIFG